jgi:hypothetical protein
MTPQRLLQFFPEMPKNRLDDPSPIEDSLRNLVTSFIDQFGGSIINEWSVGGKFPTFFAEVLGTQQ